jgi:uncharacterized protein (TIGR03435 family)
MVRLVRLAVAGLMGGMLAVTTQPAVLACTAFCAVGGDGHVLVGNNEDWFNPRSKLWFIPPKPGAYGRMYVGFDDVWPFGGMNDRGLWYDAFAAPALRAAGSADLPSYRGEIVDAAMSQCATVEEVVQLVSGYNRSYLTEGILMFADASGDAVSIEANAIVRKKGAHFVQTNFHQSRGQRGPGLERYQTASSMLERAGGDISVDLFRRILAATHQEGAGPTQYSNVYDLTSRTMYLYRFHDYDHVVAFRLDEELKKGARVLDMPSLFPRNAAADAFAASRPQPASSSPAPAIALAVLVGALVVAAIVGVVRGGRRARIGLGVAVGCVAVPAVLVTVLFQIVVNNHGPKSPQWIQFSLAPATGESAHVNSTTIRGDGPTLRGMIAEAYGFPPVRVIGPSWLSTTRYTVNATVGLDDEHDFRAMLREELDRHLHLQSHVEDRPYEAFLLRATGAPRLPRAPGQTPSIVINKGRVQFHNASMAHITAALQTILGQPVVDETGLSDRYEFELSWQSPPLQPVTAALRDRFGLELAATRVEMETLVIDHARRDPALFLLAQAGRFTRLAPAAVRDKVIRFLAID